MDEIYFRYQKNNEIEKSSSQTVRFLMNFSKSFHVINYKKFKFENNLN